jgi:hypothetical protein
LRRNVSTAGIMVTKLFGFKKGTFASGLCQIVVTFAFWALIHMVGAMAGCYEDGGYWEAMFFLAQPVGIVIEDIVMASGRSLGIKKSGELWCFHFCA